jgi:hypothetical protein
MVYYKYIECKKAKFILCIPLSVGLEGGHRNMLIINYHTLTFERYEPHGDSTRRNNNISNKKIDDILKMMMNYINMYYKEKFTYLDPSKTCPVKKGFQSLDKKEREKEGLKDILYNNIVYKEVSGYCCMWSYFMMELRLKNPKIDASKLIGKGLKELNQGNNPFLTFIRAFTSNIMDDMENAFKGISETISKGSDIVNNSEFKTRVKNFTKQAFKNKRKKLETINYGSSKEEKKVEKKADFTSLKGISDRVKKTVNIKPKKIVNVNNPNYSIMSKKEQMDLLVNQDIKETKKQKEERLSKKYYGDSKNFYKDINDILSKSVSKARTSFLKYGITDETIKRIYGGQSKGAGIDFYPTPKECVDTLLKGAYIKNQTMNILEGTSGIGSVVYHILTEFKKRTYNRDYIITSNELQPLYLDIQKKFIKDDKVIFMNKDFFKMDVNNNYDYIFLNPPFQKDLLLKFLLRGLQMINNSRQRGEIVLQFICPAGFMNWTQEDILWERMIRPSKSFDYGSGLLSLDFVVKEMNTMLDTTINKQDLIWYIEGDAKGKADVIKDNFDFYQCNFIKECKGFGGTGTKAYMYEFLTV